MCVQRKELFLKLALNNTRKSSELHPIGNIQLKLIEPIINLRITQVYFKKQRNGMNECSLKGSRGKALPRARGGEGKRGEAKTLKPRKQNSRFSQPSLYHIILHNTTHAQRLAPHSYILHSSQL